MPRSIRQLDVRLLALYLGVLAFGAFTAWLASFGLGVHSSGTLPRAAAVDRRAGPVGTPRALPASSQAARAPKGPVLPTTTVPRPTTVPPRPAARPATVSPSAPPTAASPTKPASLVPADASSSPAAASQPEVVPSQGAVVRITASTDKPSTSRTDKPSTSSPDKPSSSATTDTTSSKDQSTTTTTGGS